METTVQLQAPDISCSHCVGAIKSRVGDLEGVSAVDANVETKLVDISFDADKVSLEQIQAEMEDEGYPAKPV